MNLRRIYDQLVARVALDPSDRKALLLSRKIRKQLGRAQHREDDRKRRLVALQRAIEQGSRLLALDCEWTIDRPITEVGLVVYHQGKIEARNIRVVPCDYAEEFLYGKSEYLSFPDTIREIKQAVDESDLLIGHALLNDRRKLGQWLTLHDRVFDTMTFGRAMYPNEKLKLKHMAHRVGLKMVGAHNGGNDAMMTMFVALSLVGLQGHCRGAVLHNEPPRRFPSRLDKGMVPSQ